ncbi:MAG: lipase family protein [Cyanobacteria bacterium P01_A01_bin.135]
MVNYAKAAQLAIYCQDIYQDFSVVMFQGLAEEPLLISNSPEEKIDSLNTDTQCAVLRDGTVATIVFRGSESSYDWEINFDTAQERAEFDEKIIQDVIVEEEAREQDYPYQGRNRSESLIHRGFTAAYFSVRDQLHQAIASRDITEVAVTGHSLGGALATLCAVDLQYNFPSLKSLEAYTFGAPRVGNRGFSESYNERVPRSYRFVNGMDIVPALPRWWQGRYAHVASEVRIGQRVKFSFLQSRFKDHGIAEYIEALKLLA